PRPIPGRGEKGNNKSPGEDVFLACLPSPGGGVGGAGRGAGVRARPTIRGRSVLQRADTDTAGPFSGRADERRSPCAQSSRSRTELASETPRTIRSPVGHPPRETAKTRSLRRPCAEAGFHGAPPDRH